MPIIDDKPVSPVTAYRGDLTGDDIDILSAHRSLLLRGIIFCNFHDTLEGHLKHGVH
jgi:hypothetical protein